MKRRNGRKERGRKERRVGNREGEKDKSLPFLIKDIIRHLP